MKIKWIIAVTIILFLSTSSVSAQQWKVYPYHKEGTLIYFPKDEGIHPEYALGSGVEWWYTNLHFKGETTGKHYSAMAAFFNYHFRIFNLADETNHDFYSIFDLGSLSASEDSLNLSFVSPRGNDHWSVKTDANGQMLPFQYHLQVGDGTGKLSVDLDAQKRPLIVGLDGLVTVGSGDSYYYSQTNLAVSGSITFKGVIENVTGVAWIDHQYGPFLVSPVSEESYEWFSLQLDNGMDLILWNIFTGSNDIPMDASHRLCTILIDDLNQDTTSTFTLERLTYWKYRPGSYFANKWHFVDTIHKIDVTIEPLFDNQVVPFLLNTYFWEGSCSVSGIVNGDSVKGTAFAELLHIYRVPSITVVSPNGGESWDGDEAVVWMLNNPDDGDPLTYDVFYSADSGKSYIPIVTGIIDTSYFWDVSGLTPGDSYLVKIIGYSIDSTIVGVDCSDRFFSIVPPAAVREAEPLVVTSFRLLQNYPNPFNSETMIRFDVKEACRVQLKVFDIRGAEVATLVDGHRPPGMYKVQFDARKLPSGIYFYQIRMKNFVAVKKMTLLQ
ncbi:MAG: T9SS type A sorting domain-containing protein [Deltaproteobacteria bacterium]|nr:T9SS type A sorting domain-containing protein [Deltaproteobacteria bacterium]